MVDGTSILPYRETHPWIMPSSCSCCWHSATTTASQRADKMMLKPYLARKDLEDEEAPDPEMAH